VGRPVRVGLSSEKSDCGLHYINQSRDNWFRTRRTERCSFNINGSVFEGTRHYRNTAISDMKSESPASPCRTGCPWKIPVICIVSATLVIASLDREANSEFLSLHKPGKRIMLDSSPVTQSSETNGFKSFNGLSFRDAGEVLGSTRIYSYTLH
jgi:hypothetical protein